MTVPTLTPEKEREQQEILDSCDPAATYEFARDVSGADIGALQQVVVDGRDPEYAYEFARDVSGADISALQQVIVDSGDVRWAYAFAKYIPGADIGVCQQAVVVYSCDPEYAYHFASCDVTHRLKIGGLPASVRSYPRATVQDPLRSLQTTE